MSCYALGDSRTPMYVSLASIATNYVVASLMIRAAGMGHAGLALSTSAVAISGFVALFWILRNRIGGVHGRALVRDAARILAATAAMAAVVWLSSRAVQPLGHLIDVAVSVPLGALVFFLAGRWCGIKELKLVRVPGLRRF